MKKIYDGLNIQYPISQIIMNGSKRIETRFYPLPAQYVGKQLAVIETPGKTGKFKARIVGLITFGESYKYNSAKEFYADYENHKVSKDSEWAWVAGKNKWAWPITEIVKFKTPKAAPERKGIRFTKNIPFR
mgnify:CR=1 FL=1